MTDLVMFLLALENTLTHGVGGMVLFACEVRSNSYRNAWSSLNAPFEVRDFDG